MNIPEKRRDVTVSELRLLAAALIDFRRDFPGEIPVARTPVSLEFLKGTLIPDYLVGVPRVDGWGTAYLYWSDGEEFAVMSAGSDGEFGEFVLAIEETSESEQLEPELCRGEYEFEGTDYIWWFANMCQWPARDAS